MLVIYTLDELRRARKQRRNVSLVPTMGNLHRGHLSLVQKARERSDFVVTSIFVNRLQFAPDEDFEQYPRTFETDCDLLAGSGCDLVFAPPDSEIYPDHQDYSVRPPAELADILEGEVRPGFFTGVCTVVLKLFNIVQPDLAVFGKKDFQQLLVIQRMTEQLALPIELLPADIVRDANGLALSSRNGYLDDAQRVEAAELYATLNRLVAAARSGRSNWRQLECEAREHLSARGWQPDYVAVRRQSDLVELSGGEPRGLEPLVVLAAATLGSTRLIDNVEM